MFLRTEIRVESVFDFNDDSFFMLARSFLMKKKAACLRKKGEKTTLSGFLTGASLNLHAPANFWQPHACLDKKYLEARYFLSQTMCTL